MTQLTSKKLEKAVQKALIEWFSPLGFVREDNGGCGRWENDRYTYIACIVSRVGGENRVLPFGQMGFKETKEIYQAFMHDKNLPSPNISVDLQVGYAHFMHDWRARMLCESVEELDAFLKELHDFIFNKLYPTLSAFTEPRQVLELYLKKNEDPRDFALPAWSGYGSALTGLILARLYAPENYAELKVRYHPIIDPLLPEYKERAMKLIAYLDQEELTPLG
jgi:hypothetical protein